MAVLLRTQRVLHIDYSSHEYVTFTQSDDEGSELMTLGIIRALWDDLGHPLELTLTIEPGDKLNN